MQLLPLEKLGPRPAEGQSRIIRFRLFFALGVPGPRQPLISKDYPRSRVSSSNRSNLWNLNSHTGLILSMDITRLMKWMLPASRRNLAMSIVLPAITL